MQREQFMQRMDIIKNFYEIDNFCAEAETWFDLQCVQGQECTSSAMEAFEPVPRLVPNYPGPGLCVCPGFNAKRALNPS